MSFLLCLIFSATLASISGCTRGLWPMPQTVAITEEIRIDPTAFQFKILPGSVATFILIEALARYDDLVFVNGTNDGGDAWPSPSSPTLNVMGVFVQQRSELNGATDESYNITIPANGGTGRIDAVTEFGAIRALETFSQLVRVSVDGANAAVCGDVSVVDFPRFSFRGFLIDSSRHFLPVHVIEQHIDAMAYSKFNVLHWHLVDDQAFPFVSTVFPDLAIKGAWRYPSHAYTPVEVQHVIRYAMLRGVRVVPEFDTPGHTLSWGRAYPNLLTTCYWHGKPDGTFGPLDPTLPTTYLFVDKLFQEVFDAFPDDYVHVGGDEVTFDCWQSNANVTSFMQKMGFGTDYSKLESYYMSHVLATVMAANKSAIVWEDVFDNRARIAPNTIVDVWKQATWQTVLAAVTAANFAAILSAPWYLNYIGYGSMWMGYYTVEPTAFNGTAAQKALVLGGEACIWGEFVDATNLISRAWPSACAIGERLWSDEGVNNVLRAIPRMHDHRCRLVGRGIQAEPADGPSFCNVEF